MMAPRTDRPAQGRNTGIAQYRGGQLLSETQQTIVSEAGMNHNFENKKKNKKPEITQILELSEKCIIKVTTHKFNVFKKVEGAMNTMKRVMQDIKKRTKWHLKK